MSIRILVCAALVAAVALAFGSLIDCQSCSRSVRTGSREPKSEFISYKLRSGGILQVPRDKIPKHLQTNCDVCPDWCKLVDLRPLPISVILAQYPRLAVQHRSAEGEPQNKAGDQLERMACIIAAGGSVAHREFSSLLGHDDPYVRLVAGIHALEYRLDVPAARQTLEALAAHEYEEGLMGRYGMLARVRLFEFDAGAELTLP